MNEPVIAYRWVTDDGLHNYVSVDLLKEFLLQTNTPREILIPMTWKDFRNEALEYRKEISRLQKENDMLRSRLNRRSDFDGRRRGSED